MHIESHDGRAITSVADWERLAPPASERHWREYRSARELAHAWIHGDAHERLEALVGARLTRAIAERKTYFDDIRSGPRNHDLLVIGPEIVVGVEAKADETFGQLLSEWTAGSGTKRLDDLIAALFGERKPADGSLRYQLLAALAGTLADARELGVKRAALVVHEFVTPETHPTKHALNAVDLAAFVRRLGGEPGEGDAWLAGPFTVPGNAYLPGDVTVHVGKLRTTVVRRSGGVADSA